MKLAKLGLWSGLVVAALGAAIAQAEDWPEWGRDKSRNMVSAEKNMPVDFTAGTYKGETDAIDMSTTRNVKWIAKLGSQAYGNPTISNGRIFVGTNNESPRDPKYKGDRGVIYCLDEATGELLWQFNGPKLGSGKVSDWEFLGICSSPSVDGNRLYMVTNLCQVVCLDTNGLADGNDGPFKDEAKYLAGKGKPPITLAKGDADIIWVYDMRVELGIFPHNITSSSILQLGDRLYVNTSNGVDWSHINIPNPRAPSLIALDKKTGKLVGEEISEISTRVLHGNWSSPSTGKVGEQAMVFFGGGDGFCYAYDPVPFHDKEEDMFILKELWRCDGNPKRYRERDGKKIKYATEKGPSEFIASPVFHKNRVYVPIGQDPEHGQGVGNMLCIDASKRGDISADGIIWQYDKLDRSISTVSIAGGLVYVADYAGVLHCLDEDSGKLYWTHDTQGHIWSSTLVADGKVYLGNEDGYLTILAAGKEKKMLKEVEFTSPIYASPVAANGVLYIQTQTHLYAIGGTK